MVTSLRLCQGQWGQATRQPRDPVSSIGDLLGELTAQPRPKSFSIDGKQYGRKPTRFLQRPRDYSCPLFYALPSCYTPSLSRKHRLLSTACWNAALSLVSARTSSAICRDDKYFYITWSFFPESLSIIGSYI